MSPVAVGHRAHRLSTLRQIMLKNVGSWPKFVKWPRCTCGVTRCSYARRSQKRSLTCFRQTCHCFHGKWPRAPGGPNPRLGQRLRLCGGKSADGQSGRLHLSRGLELLSAETAGIGCESGLSHVHAPAASARRWLLPPRDECWWDQHVWAGQEGERIGQRRLATAVRTRTSVCEVCGTHLVTEVHHDPPWHETHHHRSQQARAVCVACHRRLHGAAG